MNDKETQAGLEILRERWEARVDFCTRRLRDFTLSLEERHLIEREKITYQIVLHEFVTGLKLEPRDVLTNL